MGRSTGDSRMTSERIKRVVQSFRSNVSLVCGFLGFERAEVNLFAINLNGRLPLASSEFFRANQFAGAIASRPALVLAILGCGGVTQIRNPVVVTNAVNVVDVASRPRPVNVEPSKSVLSVAFTGHPNTAIPTLVVSVTGPFTGQLDASSIHKPSEYAGLWGVVKKCAQFFCANIGLSHDAPYQRIGQKPRRVTSTPGLRHFNMGGAV